MSKRILVIIVVTIIIVGIVIYYKKSTKSSVDIRPSIYYRVNDSVVHDSGIEPEKDFILRISKIEYNDGIRKELSGIKKLEYGTNPFELNKSLNYNQLKIEDKGDIWCVTI